MTFVEKLRELPRSERLDELTAVVLAEFRCVLLMTDEDLLPMDENYFSLGVTSLSLMEIKERLELRLGAPISAATLFNHPTIEQFIDHLTDDVLAEVFTRSAQVAAAQPIPAQPIPAQHGPAQHGGPARPIPTEPIRADATTVDVRRQVRQ